MGFLGKPRKTGAIFTTFVKGKKTVFFCRLRENVSLEFFTETKITETIHDLNQDLLLVSE